MAFQYKDQYWRCDTLMQGKENIKGKLLAADPYSV